MKISISGEKKNSFANISLRDPLSWREMVARYQVFFVDLVGVVYDGISYWDHALEALRLIAPPQQLIFLSNTPRPSSLSKATLSSLLGHSHFHIVTSGDWARMQLLKIPGPVYHWGAESNTDLTQSLPLSLTFLWDNAQSVLLTFFQEEGRIPPEREEEVESHLSQILEHRLPVFCPNPDRYALYGSTYRRCAGWFAQRLSERGASVTLWGKPQADFYEFAFSHLSSRPPLSECLMIGDTLETDTLGAHRYGIDSLLVLSGITGRRGNREEIFDQFEKGTLAPPTYVLDRLAHDF